MPKTRRRFTERPASLRSRRARLLRGIDEKNAEVRNVRIELRSELGTLRSCRTDVHLSMYNILDVRSYVLARIRRDGEKKLRATRMTDAPFARDGAENGVVTVTFAVKVVALSGDYPSGDKGGGVPIGLFPFFASFTSGASNVACAFDSAGSEMYTRPLRINFFPSRLYRYRVSKVLETRACSDVRFSRRSSAKRRRSPSRFFLRVGSSFARPAVYRESLPRRRALAFGSVAREFVENHHG